jgi:hypothetical protein
VIRISISRLAAKARGVRETRSGGGLGAPCTR